MPPASMVTFPFLKQVFKGEKKLMKVGDVNICNPARYDEISVSNLYNDCIKLPDMADYFPDKYPKGRTCSREYFFSILSSLHPEYTSQLLLKSKELRFGDEAQDEKKETIEVNEDWAEQLKAYPQFTSK